MKWIRLTSTRLVLLCALLLAIQALIAPLPASAEKRPPPKHAQVERSVTVANVKDLGEGGYTATIDGRKAILMARSLRSPQLLNGSWFYATLTANFTIKWSVK